MEDKICRHCEYQFASLDDEPCRYCINYDEFRPREAPTSQKFYNDIIEQISEMIMTYGMLRYNEGYERAKNDMITKLKGEQ